MDKGNKKKQGKPSGARKGKSVAKKVEGNIKSVRPVASKKVVANENEMRLNKYISNSGMCTRREADLYIETGSVKVNGKVVTEMGFKVQLTDEVRFDGQLITPVKRSYVLLNKPRGFTVESNTTNIEKSVQSLVYKASKAVLNPIGKMERGATGLLLLTNDNSMLASLNGSGRVRQIFHVELDKNLARVDYEKILEGVYIDENIVKVQDLSYVENSKTEIGVQLFSQRNRIVTRIFEKLGYTVNKIDRVVYGGLTKKDLPRGNWRELTKQEIINMKMIY